MPSAHSHTPDVSFDGGDLDCDGGLLLLIRQHIDPLPRGGLLEILSTEISVKEDLPAWCRLTGNELVGAAQAGKATLYLVCKGSVAERHAGAIQAPRTQSLVRATVAVRVPARLPDPAPAPAIPPLAVMSIGSWPRPRWMLQAMHERMEGRLPEGDFDATADDAVRLAVKAQLRAIAEASQRLRERFG